MQLAENANAAESIGAVLTARAGITEGARARGKFIVECIDKDGNLKWNDEIENTVLTAGKNLALDSFLAGSAYTVTGPYMGLISSSSYSSISAADTMASHAGWLEAGNTNAPTYSGSRKTCAWSAASAGSKALSAALNFTFTGSGTVKGVFIVFGSGAVNTIDNTSGTAYSAGLLSGGDKTVASSDQLNISYTGSL